MTGPRLVRWNEPSGRCPGCAGCSIRRALAERETFSRSEMAHMLALAFRSGAQLAHDMAEDVTRWAADPLVARMAGGAYRSRREKIDAGAERFAATKSARRYPPMRAGVPEGLHELDDARRASVVVDPHVEWPEVAIPGGSGDA